MLAFTLGAVAACGLVGCREDLPTAQPCRNVPDGGCPRSRGVACDDPTCGAVYLCREDRTWELEKICPARTADAAPAPPRPDAAPPPPRDAGIVLPEGASGGPGCGTLQAPDCPLATAYGCPNGCCGCEDLFVCERGGWTTWGICGDAGVIPNKR